MKSIKFSVSMCVYGGDNARQFDTALRSIINQTVKPTEIVLTVDGPIPADIETVISKYNNSLLSENIVFNVVRLIKNVGHGEARRICFSNCTCDYIALMDADDISVPDRFEKQLKFLKKNPKISIVGGNIKEFISQEDPDDLSHEAGNRLVPERDNEIKMYMRKRCPMNQVTVMFKRSDVEEVGGYIDWFCEEDYYLWIRLALADKQFGNIPDILVNVRVGEEMYQRRGGIKYFISEARLQSFMLQKKLISIPRYCINVGERLALQVLMPTSVRGWLFQKFARK